MLSLLHCSQNKNAGDFQSGEPSLYDAFMVDTCHYTFAQAHRMFYTKSKP